MEEWQAIILGLVQGLTEFLPVSSSAHLAIGKELLGVESASDLIFEVAVHSATALAIILVFRTQIWDLLKGFFRFEYNSATQYLLKIALSMVPVFVVGVFFKDYVEAVFSSMTVIGAALLLTGCLLFLSEKLEGKSREITYGNAFIIGISQALAVIPGLSRSGATISTGLLCGVRREEVAQFSFLMVLVPILGEAFLDLVSGEVMTSSVGVMPLALGFASAFISGLFACRVMIALVKKARLGWFALYCALVGISVLLFL